MIADRILVLVRPGEISPALQRLRSLDVKGRGWRDKIRIVWLLDEGRNVAPAELAATVEQAALAHIPHIKQLLARLDPELFRLNP